MVMIKLTRKAGGRPDTELMVNVSNIEMVVEESDGRASIFLVSGWKERVAEKYDDVIKMINGG